MPSWREAERIREVDVARDEDAAFGDCARLDGSIGWTAQTHVARVDGVVPCRRQVAGHGSWQRLVDEKSCHVSTGGGANRFLLREPRRVAHGGKDLVLDEVVLRTQLRNGGAARELAEHKDDWNLPAAACFQRASKLADNIPPPRLRRER
jgi:hypothetical protein